MESQHYISVINEYSVYLQAEKGMAPATCESYLKAAEIFFSVVRSRPVELFLPQDWDWSHLDKRALEIYLAHLGGERGWQPSSVRQQLSALRVFFRFLQYRGYIARNPIRGLKPPPAPALAKLPEGEQEAVARLFFHPAAGLAPARLMAVLELIYGGGLRPSAAYRIGALTLSRAQGVAKFTSGETTGEVTLSEAGLNRLQTYLDERNKVTPQKGVQAFWVGARGAPVGPPQLARAVKQTMEKEGLPGGGRTLRQLSALHFRERGGDVRSLQTFLKAKRLGTLDRFGTPDFQDVLREFRRFHPREEGEDDS